MSTEQWSEEHKQERAMIERRLASEGIHPEEKDWSISEDDHRPEVALGRAEVVEEDEDKGLYSGDQGVVTACCVGAADLGNLHVAYYFTSDDHDSGESVSLDQVNWL